MSIKKWVAVTAVLMFTVSGCGALSRLPQYQHQNLSAEQQAKDGFDCEKLAAKESEWDQRWNSGDAWFEKMVAVIMLPILAPFLLYAADKDADIYLRYYENCLYRRGYRRMVNPEN